MRRIFWGFCRNGFLMSPLQYLSTVFCFEFAEIFVFEKRFPAITDTGSRRLPASLICGVGDSPHHRYGESAIEIFKRKISVSMIRRVIDSPHQWYGELPTPRIVESESRRLHVSLIRRVTDSPYRWDGESTTPHIGDTGSRYLKKKFV
jgi:hypothetical protein